MARTPPTYESGFAADYPLNVGGRRFVKKPARHVRRGTRLVSGFRHHNPHDKTGLLMKTISLLVLLLASGLALHSQLSGAGQVAREA